MKAQASILRLLLAGGLVAGVSGCGPVESWLENNATTKPADVSGLSSADAAKYGKVATQIGLVDGLVDGFGSGVGSLAKGGSGARLAVASGSDCPVIDIVSGFNPSTYPPSPLPDSVSIDYDYTNSVAQPCLDENGNPLLGSYSVAMTGLDDETWPGSLLGTGSFTDPYRWRFDDATMVFAFDDMEADLPAGVVTKTTGKLKAVVTTDGSGNTTKVATNVGGIRTLFDDGAGTILTGLFSDLNLTKALPVGSDVSTNDGTFRLAVALFGYVDVTLDNVVVDQATCPHHPISGTVSFAGKDGDTVSLDFATGTCNTADETLADSTVVNDVVIEDIL
jgi:hypothetical protein